MSGLSESFSSLSRELLRNRWYKIWESSWKTSFEMLTELFMTYNLWLMKNAILGPLWLWDIQKHDFKWIHTSFLCQKWFSKKQNPVLKFLQCIITINDYCKKSYQVSLLRFRSLPFDSKVHHLHLQTLIHDIV